jgi:hypothetical protein
MKHISWLALITLLALSVTHGEPLAAFNVACTNDNWTGLAVPGLSQFFNFAGASGCVWTGSQVILWGYNNGVAAGGAYDPETGAWTAISTVNQPEPRGGFLTVWTGTDMVIWGGGDLHGNLLDTGFLYNPATSSWGPMSVINAPDPNGLQAAVWTGTEVIIWGGSGGARYNPGTDTWAPMNSANMPPQSLFSSPSAVWTGTEMLAWGAQELQEPGLPLSPVGGRYDPQTDIWAPISTLSAPPGTGGASLVWTGTEMIAWGGNEGEAVGAAYDPNTDTWAPISRIGAPLALGGFPVQVTAWTGQEMVVWGNPSVLGGGRYDPLTDTWTSISTTAAPQPGSFLGVWTGSQMIVVGISLLSGGEPLLTAEAYCASPPPGCMYTLSQQSQTFPSIGGNGSISLTSASGCAWTADSAAPWITITSGTAGTGDGKISYSVAPNAGAASQSASILVAGQTFTISEAGAPAIASVSANGKNLIVGGSGFGAGATVLLNGVGQKTGYSQGPDTLVGKKSVKQLAHGQTAPVQVQNPDGALSNVVNFTRP